MHFRLTAEGASLLEWRSRLDTIGLPNGAQTIEDQPLDPAHRLHDRDDYDREPPIRLDLFREADYGRYRVEAIRGSAGIYVVHHLRNLDDAAFWLVHGPVRPASVHVHFRCPLWRGMGRNGLCQVADRTLRLVFPG